MNTVIECCSYGKHLNNEYSVYFSVGFVLSIVMFEVMLLTFRKFKTYQNIFRITNLKALFILRMKLHVFIMKFYVHSLSRLQ